MKKKVLKVMAVLGFSIGLLIGCGMETENSGQADLKDTIVVGMDDTFAPMGFRNNEGEITGFDVDLANEAGKRMGKKIVFQPIDWAMKETELIAGNIDVIWNGYSITDERKEKVAFTTPYAENKQVIVVLEDSSIQTKADLAGKNVAAQQSSSTVDAILADPTAISEKFADGKIIQFPSNNDVFNDLNAGRSDAIVVDETLGRYYMKQHADIKYRILEDDFGKEEYGVGVRKGDKTLKETLDQALAEMKEDGTYDTIYAKWFSE